MSFLFSLSSSYLTHTFPPQVHTIQWTSTWLSATVWTILQCPRQKWSSLSTSNSMLSWRQHGSSSSSSLLPSSLCVCLCLYSWGRESGLQLHLLDRLASEFCLDYEGEVQMRKVDKLCESIISTTLLDMAPIRSCLEDRRYIPSIFPTERWEASCQPSSSLWFLTYCSWCVWHCSVW